MHSMEYSMEFFTHSTNKNNRIIVRVLNLSKFDNFDKLYQALPLDKCGYKKDEVKNAHPNDMLEYYSIEQQNNYGVIGIEVDVVRVKEIIKITDMTEEHYEQKGYVHYQSWNETYTGLMNQEYLDKRALERCILIARQYPQNTIVTILDNQVVGFAAYNKSSDNLDDTGEIYAIYILQAFQKLGIGKSLLVECKKRLNEFKQISLYVLDKNYKAIKWYEANGFNLDGHIKVEKTSIDNYSFFELRMIYEKQ